MFKPLVSFVCHTLDLISVKTLLGNWTRATEHRVSSGVPCQQRLKLDLLSLIHVSWIKIYGYDMKPLKINII